MCGMESKKRKACRPQKEIDWNLVDNLLIAGCTGPEVAAALGISVITLYHRTPKDKDITFNEYAQKFRSKGDSMLRTVQFKKAMSGDNTQLIWLGKNRLGQRDKPEEAKEFSEEDIRKFNEYMDMLKRIQQNQDRSGLDKEDKSIKTPISS